MDKKNQHLEDRYDPEPGVYRGVLREISKYTKLENVRMKWELVSGADNVFRYFVSSKHGTVPGGFLWRLLFMWKEMTFDDVMMMTKSDDINLLDKFVGQEADVLVHRYDMGNGCTEEFVADLAPAGKHIQKLKNGGYRESESPWILRPQLHDVMFYY